MAFLIRRGWGGGGGYYYTVDHGSCTEYALLFIPSEIFLWASVLQINIIRNFRNVLQVSFVLRSCVSLISTHNGDMKQRRLVISWMSVVRYVRPFSSIRYHENNPKTAKRCNEIFFLGNTHPICGYSDYKTIL